MAFTGFSTDTLKFLKGLAKNNDKVWFDKHRQDYEAHWLEAGKAFVEAIEPKLKKLSPHVNCQPKVNGSIFRINRDVRFSQDKTPYKDHLDFWFWEGPERKKAISGYFFRVKADHVAIGVGAHGFDKDKLKAYRELVAQDRTGKALVAARKKIEKAGYKLEGEHYKRPPKGFDLEGDREPLVRFNALWVGHEAPISAVVTSKKILDECVSHWKKMQPVHRWLVDELQ